MNLLIRRGCACLALAVGFAATACSEPETSRSSRVDVQVSAEVADLVPEQIRQRGTLRVAVPDIGAPLAYREGNDLRGMDPALGEAVANLMGLEYKPEMIPFSAALPGLQSGRYDIAYGQYYVTPERLQVVDFVTDWRDFSSFMVPTDSDIAARTVTDVCGMPIGAMDGSIELKFLDDAQAACSSQGKPAISVNAFPSISAGALAMSSGRVEAVLISRGTGQTVIDKGQPFKLVGEIGGGPCATAVARTDYSGQMLAAVRKAYEVLTAQGAYARILENSKTGYGAIDNPTVYTSGSSYPDYQ